MITLNIFLAGFVCGQVSLFLLVAFFMGAGGDPE